VLRVLSLGAGVQSSTLALMVAAGEIPMIDCAIFADTKHEPTEVYRWLDWLESRLPFPVHRVTAGDLVAETLRTRTSKKNGKDYGKNYIPSFQRGAGGKLSALPRKCSTDFKLVPIHRKLRELVKPKRKGTAVLATSLIGISYDEAHRMKTAWFPWLWNEYPLVERSMTRWHCLQWMKDHGYPEPPRSACIFCPYHSDKEWIHLRDQSPAEFETAVVFERALRASAAARQVTGVEYLHRDLKPLDQVELRDDRVQADAFGNECEGICGV
jgi:hypothetical protein